MRSLFAAVVVFIVMAALIFASWWVYLHMLASAVKAINGP